MTNTNTKCISVPRVVSPYPSAMILCRLSQAEAEHMMMAPSVAGGWVAVHPDCREAVTGALPAVPADLLALLPRSWGKPARPVTRDQAAAIIYQLDLAAQHPVYADDGTIAADFAGRVRAHFGFGPEPIDPIRPPRIVAGTILYLIGSGPAECLGRIDWYGQRAARDARAVPGAPLGSVPVVVVGVADDGSPCQADPLNPRPYERGWLAEIACDPGMTGALPEHWSPTGKRWPLGDPRKARDAALLAIFSAQEVRS